jgi:hypothetical protein
VNFVVYLIAESRVKNDFSQFPRAKDPCVGSWPRVTRSFGLGLFFGLGLAAIVEGGVVVLEELLEAQVDLIEADVEFVARVGNRDLLEGWCLRRTTISCVKK